MSPRRNCLLAAPLARGGEGERGKEEEEEEDLSRERERRLDVLV